jgi:hypothetical protein
VGKKSSQKGIRGENDAIALLEKYWGGKFRRSGRGFSGGDIIEYPPDFPWVVEIKDLAGVNAIHLFYPNALLKDAIRQAQGQAKGKPWLLVIKIDRHWFMLTTTDGVTVKLRDFQQCMVTPMEILSQGRIVACPLVMIEGMKHDWDLDRTKSQPETGP